MGKKTKRRAKTAEKQRNKNTKSSNVGQAFRDVSLSLDKRKREQEHQQHLLQQQQERMKKGTSSDYIVNPTNTPAEEQMQSITYPHPEVFFPGEMKLQNSLEVKWNPLNSILKKRLPPLSQILFHELFPEENKDFKGDDIPDEEDLSLLSLPRHPPLTITIDKNKKKGEGRRNYQRTMLRNTMAVSADVQPMNVADRMLRESGYAAAPYEEDNSITSASYTNTTISTLDKEYSMSILPDPDENFVRKRIAPMRSERSFYSATSIDNSTGGYESLHHLYRHDSKRSLLSGSTMQSTSQMSLFSSDILINASQHSSFVTGATSSPLIRHRKMMQGSSFNENIGGGKKTSSSRKLSGDPTPQSRNTPWSTNQKETEDKKNITIDLVGRSVWSSSTSAIKAAVDAAPNANVNIENNSRGEEDYDIKMKTDGATDMRAVNTPSPNSIQTYQDDNSALSVSGSNDSAVSVSGSIESRIDSSIDSRNENGKTTREFPLPLTCYNRMETDKMRNISVVSDGASLASKNSQYNSPAENPPTTTGSSLALLLKKKSQRNIMSGEDQPPSKNVSQPYGFGRTLSNRIVNPVSMISIPNNGGTASRRGSLVSALTRRESVGSIISFCDDILSTNRNSVDGGGGKKMMQPSNAMTAPLAANRIDQGEEKETDQLQDEDDERSLKEFVNLMDGGDDVDVVDGTTTHDTMDTSRSARRSTFKIKNSKKPTMFDSSERRSTFRIANTSSNKANTNINGEQHTDHQTGRFSMPFSAVDEEEPAKNNKDEKADQNEAQQNLRRPSQPIGPSYYQQSRTPAYQQQQRSQQQKINHENLIISVPADYRRGSMVSTLSTRDDVVFNNRSFRTSLSDYQPHNPQHQNYGSNPYFGDNKNSKNHSDSTSFLRQASRGERARRDSHFSASIPPPLRDNQSREFFANKSKQENQEEDQSEIDDSLCSNEQIQDTDSLHSGDDDGFSRKEGLSEPKFERMTTGKTTNTKNLVSFEREEKYEDEDQKHLHEKSTHSRRRDSHQSVSIPPPLRSNESGGYFLKNINRVRQIEEEAADANAHLFSDLGMDEGGSSVEKGEEKEVSTTNFSRMVTGKTSNQNNNRDVVTPNALDVNNGNVDGRYPPQVSPVRMISIPNNRRGSMISTLSLHHEDFTNKNHSSSTLSYNRDVSPRMRHLRSRVSNRPRRDSHQSHSIEAPQRRVSESIDDQFEFGGDDILQLGKKYSYVSTEDEHDNEETTLTSLDRMITGKMSNTKKATPSSVLPITNFERMRTGKASNTTTNKSTSSLNITNNNDIMLDESSTAEDIESDTENDKREISPSNAVSFADDADTKHSLDYSKNSSSISRISNTDEEDKIRSNISKRRSTFKVNNTTHRSVSSTSIGKSRTRVYQEAVNDVSTHPRIDPKNEAFHVYAEENNKTPAVKNSSKNNQENVKDIERSRRRSTFKISNSSRSNGTGLYHNNSFEGDNIEEDDEELSSVNSSVHDSNHDDSNGAKIPGEMESPVLGRIARGSPALSIEEEEDMMIQPTINRLFSRKKSRRSPRKDLPKSPMKDLKKDRISPFSAKSFRKNKKERQNSGDSRAKSVQTANLEGGKHLRMDLRRNDTSSRKNIGTLIKGILPKRDSFKKNKKSKSPNNALAAMTELERAETEETNNTAVAALTELERAETEETTNTTVAALTELERADTEETSNTVATESRRTETEKTSNAAALAKLEKTLSQNVSTSSDSVALSILEKSISQKSQHSSNASVGNSSIGNSTFGGNTVSSRDRRGPKTECDYTESDVSLAPPSRKVSYEKRRRKVDRDLSCSNFSTSSRNTNRSADDADDFESLSAPTRGLGHQKTGSDKSLSSSRSRRRDYYEGNHSTRSSHSIMNQSISEDADSWDAPPAPTSLRAMESSGDVKPVGKGEVIIEEDDSQSWNDWNAKLIDGPSYQDSRSHSRNSKTMNKSNSQKKNYLFPHYGMSNHMQASDNDAQESDQAAGPGLASFARQKAMQSKDSKKKKKLTKGDIEDYPKKQWQKGNEGRGSKSASNNGKEGVRSAFFKPIYPASPVDKKHSPYGNTNDSNSSQNREKKKMDPYLNHGDRRSYFGEKDESYSDDSQEFSVASEADGSVSTYDGLGTRWLGVDAASENKSVTDKISGSTTYDGLSTRWGMSTDAAKGMKSKKKQTSSSSSSQRKEWKDTQSRFAIY